MIGFEFPHRPYGGAGYFPRPYEYLTVPDPLPDYEAFRLRHGHYVVFFLDGPEKHELLAVRNLAPLRVAIAEDLMPTWADGPTHPISFQCRTYVPVGVFGSTVIVALEAQ